LAELNSGFSNGFESTTLSGPKGMPGIDEDLLKRVAERLDAPPRYAAHSDHSIIEAAAVAYSVSLSDEIDDEQTRPTGFNPNAAALFEAVVESAFLVANADGVFDTEELSAFKRVVVSSCHGKVTEQQIEALIADFADQLEEDGMQKRIEMVGRTITRPEQAAEVLRIAGLLAVVSAGVSAEERAVLERMATEFGVGAEGLSRAIAEVESVLHGF
jgi:tellurite resistance protein